MNQRLSVALFLLLVVLVITTTGTILFLRLRTDDIATTLDSEETLRLLVVVHEEDQPFLSFLLFFHPETERAAVLDIPPDVGGVMRSLGRVDDIAGTFDAEDPGRFHAEVETLTGLEIPYRIVFSRDQLARFIDLLGGLEMFVITDYRELDGEDPILLPSGNVHLDGEKAIQYLMVSIRGESELEVIGRRQTFVQAFLRTIREQADFLRHPEVVPIRRGLYDANFDSRAQNTLFAALSGLDAERLVRRRVQGTYRSVVVEGEQKRLLFPHFEGQWLKQSVRQIEQSLATLEEVESDTVVIAIEVLNGTGTTGLARRTSELYEDYGFEVVRFSNAESNQVERTIVVDRRGVGDLAERVAQVIRAERIVTEVQPESDVDVTLILGRDFDGSIVRTVEE